MIPDPAEFVDAQAILATSGVKVAPGLTPNEFDRIEHQFSLRFPPDLRAFLSIGLPVSGNWVDWRNADTKDILKCLEWPLKGICFDIEHNAFWFDEWGSRPQNLKDALEIARRAIAEAPLLIPIFSHRYLPATPSEAGNPVFSVYQTDIIDYGSNLLDYLRKEFNYHSRRTAAHNLQPYSHHSVLVTTGGPEQRNDLILIRPLPRYHASIPFCDPFSLTSPADFPAILSPLQSH